MRPMTTLPASYEPHRTLDLSKNRWLLVILNLGGLVLFFLYGWLFITLASWLRPAEAGLLLEISGSADFLTFVAVTLLLLVAQVILHEAIHGLFFWLFTGSRPTFGFKGFYAYAAAPEWYLPRNQHLIVALAPLVLVTLGGFLLVPFVPLLWVLALLLMMTMNAAGAIGDVVVAGWLLFQPATVLIRDIGDAITLYRRKRMATEESTRTASGRFSREGESNNAI